MKPQYRGPFLVAAVLFASAILGGIYGPDVKAVTSSAEGIQEATRDFVRVLVAVQSNYAEPVDVDHVVYEGAIPGMLRVLDPHSRFIDQKEWTLSLEEREGKYYGVGMVIEARDNHTAVLDPFLDAPAFKAGLRSGDIISKIDDKSAAGLTNSDVAGLLKGAKGTSVRVTVTREGYKDPLTFTVVRDEIPRHSVEVAYQVRPGIGYIRLSTFISEQTGHEVADALRQLNVGSLEGLILDMRGNPGGMLSEAVSVSDMFLDKNQLIVSDHGRASPEQRYYAMRGNRGITVPLVVLVNNNSASATEIVSGAIQDHDRGLIVGETTFGKGLVQRVTPLSEDSGLALSTARYYTPSGRSIQRDYKALTLYEYLAERKVPTHPSDVKLTDSGRQVTGGGGITPDVVVADPKPNDFQIEMFQQNVFYPFDLGVVIPEGVGGFVRHYMGTRPAITRNFEATDEILKEFRDYLTQKKITYTAADLKDNTDWVKRKIKQEVLMYSFGDQQGLKVLLEADPQVERAEAAIPQARTLYENARRVVAQRTGGNSLHP